MFDDQIMTQIGVDFDNRQADIRAAIGQGHRGGTHYGPPIDRAAGMLTPLENTGYYILFLTDGAPGDHPAGQNAANRARNRDITVFTVKVGNVAGVDGLLQDMSGPPGGPGQAGYYFTVENNAQFQAVFRSITGNILCTIGPLDPVPAQNLEPNEIHVFIRKADGTEERMRYSNSLGDLEDEYAYKYRRDENKIRITQKACDEVMDEGAKIIARYGSASLVR